MIGTGTERSSVCLRRVAAAIAVGVTAVLAQGGVAAASSRGHHFDHHGPRQHRVLYVSAPGAAARHDWGCRHARYSTIQAAVNAAPAGATVFACPGTYTEDVIISTPLRLTGDDAVIQGSPTANGNCDQLGPTGPGSAPCLAAVTIKSSHVEVRGLTVRGAIGEGILATGSLAGGSITDVRIHGNRVTGNDTGATPPVPNSPYPQCSGAGGVPGDCGEGIHLMGVSDSRVTGNHVTGNSGGVLLTDEFGPTHGNLVARNLVTRNFSDCGITVPGHNPHALDAAGHPQPSVAGVYDNVISDNWVTDNGTTGEGAGVLFANAGPGTASYDNLVIHNYIAGNGLAGVTMHAHTVPPGMFEDLSGNRIVGNWIGTNNLTGDTLDGPPVTDPLTTGILVFSGSVPVQVTIARNRVFNDQYGVWLGVGSNVSATLRDNRFIGVTTPVFTHP